MTQNCWFESCDSATLETKDGSNYLTVTRGEYTLVFHIQAYTNYIDVTLCMGLDELRTFKPRQSIINDYIVLRKVGLTLFVAESDVFVLLKVNKLKWTVEPLQNGEGVQKYIPIADKVLVITRNAGNNSYSITLRTQNELCEKEQTTTSEF